MLELTDLPPELLIQTFSSLSPPDLLSIRLTSKYLNSIVHNSLILQYSAALLTAEAQDNPCSSLPLSTKLDALKASERSWAGVKPRWSKSVAVSANQSGVYDLTGGVYLLSNSTRRELMYLKLPSGEHEDVRWRKVDSGKTIIDIGLCLFEHDLLVIVSTTPSRISTPAQPMFDIEMQYLEFSTGRPHPLAQRANVHVMTSQWEKPAVGIEIVGDHLVLILSFLSRGRPDDRVFVYEWMKDVVKMSFLAQHRTYSGLIFLTEHLILLPNTTTNTFDIFRIPRKPTIVSPAPVLVLQLPVLAEERMMGGISCRAEPNPVGERYGFGRRYGTSENANKNTDPVPEASPDAQLTSTSSSTNEVKSGSKPPSTGTPTNARISTIPTRPFLPPAHSAICIFELRILVLRLNMLHGAWNMGFEFRDRFTFVVHRGAFVDLVEKEGREYDDDEDEDASGQMQSTGTGTANANGSGTSGQQEQQHPNSPGTPPPPPTLPYSIWAPDIARWFNSDTVSTRWITVSAGQRCVRMEDPDPTFHVGAGGAGAVNGNGGGGQGERVFSVLDFSKERVGRVRRVYEEAEERRKEKGKGKESELAPASDFEESTHNEKEDEESRMEAIRKEIEMADRLEAQRQEEDVNRMVDGMVQRAREDEARERRVRRMLRGEGEVLSGSGSAGGSALRADAEEIGSGDVEMSEHGAGTGAEEGAVDESHDHNDASSSPWISYREQRWAHEWASEKGDERLRMYDAEERDDIEHDARRLIAEMKKDTEWMERRVLREVEEAMDEDEYEGDGYDEDEEYMDPEWEPEYEDDGGDYAIVVDDDGDEEFEDVSEGEGDEDGAGDEDDIMHALGLHTLHTGLAIAPPFAQLLGGGTAHAAVSTPPTQNQTQNQAQPEQGQQHHPLRRTRLVTTMDQVQPADAFAEPVYGGLPYVEVESERRYAYDGVLLDEERVLGIFTNDEDRIEKVEILYFG